MTDPAQAVADIDTLIATGLELAQERIETDAGFFPFGLAIPIDFDSEGDEELDILEPSSDEGEINEEDALEALVEVFGENAADHRAVAVVFDSVLDDEWDAITILVAHSGAEPVDVQLPYRVAGRKRIWAEIERSPGSLEVYSTES